MAKKTVWKTVALSASVEAHGEQVDRLEFREPTGDVLLALPLPDESRSLAGAIDLAAKLADVPPSTIKSLPMTDAMEVAKIVNPLYVEFLATFGE